ncbi:TonB-dependent receptor [Parapedobacter koreensis]|uniref:Iron complex outermembrane recepter protein n=1 Tax=Parapedobacter koreensis TaxID=332977 RepID=A0A1H7F6S0_9SPHI|nr:TonB-dependent receptor [Parapedobacter koreensis]SEK21087.1 iron complex outermembrane recepter protein [Parapedobacter koreensis]
MKTIRHLAISLLIAFACIPLAQAQNRPAVITGKVTTSNGLPAEHVSVTVQGTQIGAQTDDNGAYRIELSLTGDIVLEISALGVAKQAASLTINPGNTYTQDFTINITSQQLEEVLISKNRGNYNILTPSPTLRLDAPLIEIPQNIQVVSSKTLADQQVISMGDGLIRNVSGAVRLEHWGNLYTNISMRGTQIQAFRNGFNVVSSYWGPLTEDMSFVDHIEFVKGPAGFMLANGDPSGSYNVVTKKPTGETKGEASLTIGEYNLYRATLDLDGKLNKSGKLLYRFNASAQTKGSHRANEFDNRYVLAPVVSYQVDDKTKVTAEYTLQYANMSDVGSYYVFGPTPDGYASLPRDFSMVPAGLDPTNIKDQTFLVSLTHDIDTNWKITAQGYYLHYDQVGSSMWPLSNMTDDGKIIRGVGIWDALSEMSLGQVFANGKLTTGNVQHRILVGIDVGKKNYLADWGQTHALDSANGGEFDMHNPNLGIPVNGYPVFDRTTSIEARAALAGGAITQEYKGIYIQDELGFFENRLRLTLAGRYSSASQSAYGGSPYSASRFTPRLGLSWSIDKHTAVYALYDQAFVPQSGRIYGGGEVKPITGNNQELGFKRDWADGAWNTSISVYRILKENELTTDPLHSTPSESYSIVLGQKVARGIEFDVHGRLAPGLDLVANYAYTNAEVTEVAEGVTDYEVGDDLLGYAANTANTWLTYRIQRGALKNLGAAAGFTWLWDRKTDSWDVSDVRLPAYFKLDAGLFWENDKLRITANVFNLLDEYLYSGSYYSFNNAFYWQSETPRNLRLSIGYKF